MGKSNPVCGIAGRTPSLYPTRHVDDGEKRLRKRIAGIERDCLAYIVQTGVAALASVFDCLLKSPEIIVVGIEIAGRLRACAVDLGLLDAGLDGADNAFGHRVLQRKYVLQGTIELFRPKMC